MHLNKKCAGTGQQTVPAFCPLSCKNKYCWGKIICLQQFTIGQIFIPHKRDGQNDLFLSAVLRVKKFKVKLKVFLNLHVYNNNVATIYFLLQIYISTNT